MEYIEGESLAKLIERVGRDHKLPWKFSLRVAVYIARALQYAEEQSILHRNITPNNILIRKIDQVALLGDLMLAKALEGTLAQQITMLGLLMITSKGMAGVPKASIVVIAATLAYFKLPEAGIGLILAVDQLLDMGRSATNVVGNSVASAVVAKWEGQVEDPAKA